MRGSYPKYLEELDAVRTCLGRLNVSLEAERLFKKEVGKHRLGSFINYEQQHEIFNSCFFWRNHFKCSTVLRRFLPNLEAYGAAALKERNRLDVYDVGCGAGPFSIAAWEVMPSIAPLEKVRFYLIDKSRRQLELAERLTHPLSMRRTPVRGKLPLLPSPSSSLVLLSFVMCENLNRAMCDWLKRCVQQNCLVIVVDFPDVVKEVGRQVGMRARVEPFEQNLQCREEEFQQSSISVSGMLIRDETNCNAVLQCME